MHFLGWGDGYCSQWKTVFPILFSFSFLDIMLKQGTMKAEQIIVSYEGVFLQRYLFNLVFLSGDNHWRVPFGHLALLLPPISLWCTDFLSSLDIYPADRMVDLF